MINIYDLYRETYIYILKILQRIYSREKCVLLPQGKREGGREGACERGGKREGGRERGSV